MCIDMHASYEGHLTPTGKDKKQPWFCVTRCPSCDNISFTYLRFPMAMRFRCRENHYRHREGIVQCEQILIPLEPIGMTEGEMWKTYDAWNSKHGSAPDAEK